VESTRVFNNHVPGVVPVDVPGVVRWNHQTYFLIFFLEQTGAPVEVPPVLNKHLDLYSSLQFVLIFDCLTFFVFGFFNILLVYVFGTCSGTIRRVGYQYGMGSRGELWGAVGNGSNSWQ
jgi:hypothetical protein